LAGEDSGGVRVVWIDNDHVPVGGLDTCHAKDQRWDNYSH
jgi:hypothetical protein